MSSRRDVSADTWGLALLDTPVLACGDGSLKSGDATSATLGDRASRPFRGSDYNCPKAHTFPLNLPVEVASLIYCLSFLSSSMY